MKSRWKVLSLLFVIVASLASVAAMSGGAIRVAEVDGTPDLAMTRYIKFPNGSLTRSNDVITVGAGGAWVVTGAEAGNSLLTLQADESDDSGDDWQFASVASGNTLTISNDTSGSQVAKVTIAASDGDVTLTGGITGDGGDQLVGFLRSLVTSTTTTLTAAQCGAVIVNDSADVLTLPEASTVLGCVYTFVVANASNLDINPADGTDTILPFINAVATDPTLISPAAGDAIRCATVGGSIVLIAIGNDSWAVVGGVAGHTWSDIN